MHCAAFAVFASALLLPAVAPGLQSAATSSTVPPDFSQEPIVLRDTKMVLQYNADGTGTRTESQAFTVQSEGALRNFGVVGLAYASATQKADFVFVRVRRPDGTVIETPLDGVQDQAAPVTREAPFYSDLKQKQLPVRGLHLGDTLEWETRTTIQHPEAPNQFWERIGLVRDIVTLNESVELRVPAKSQVNVWTNPADHLQPQQAEEGGERVYRWQWKSLTPTVGKEAEAAKKAREGKLLTADEEMDELQGKLPDIAFTTFANWAAVGDWYRKLEVERTQPDAAIRAKVAEITVHATSEEDKVKAVYDWVASNVRYIGVAFGIGRYQPHAASAVLDNQYGDCKDKHTLLASMLLALGEQPDAVLIGAGVRFNDAVPSPDSFNHLITRLTLKGKPVWLDTTSEVAPYQVLLPVLRDKQALVIPPTGQPSIQRTPAGSPFPAYSTFLVKGQYDKDLTFDSEVTYTFHDDNELGLRAVMRQVTPAKYDDMVQAIMNAMSLAGTASNVTLQNLNDQEKPLVVAFHYHRAHEADWGHERVMLPFAATELTAVDEKKPPVSSIRLGTPRVLDSVVEMKLPDGWKAELPEAVHQQIPQARVDVTYRLDGSTLYAERKLTIVQEKVSATDWKPYKKWFDDAGAGSVPYVQLIPPGKASAQGELVMDPSVTASAKTEAKAQPQTEEARLAEAIRLVASASDKLRQNRVDAAEEDLNAAKELNPNQRDLWGDLGVVAYRHGNLTLAMELYRKEVQLHPGADFAWRNLVSVQSRDNHKAAEATAREWIAASPRTLEPRAWLVQILSSDQQTAAALEAAKAASTELPEDIREGNDCLFLLGKAQLSAGEADGGAQTMTRLLNNHPTPMIRNNAAYELAKAHRQLPLAESTERAVLQELEAQTLTWTGDESPATLQSTSSLLSASWDTMGWILYQEGKYADAEPYIRAAWRNAQHAEIAEHLGEVLRALHRDDQAQAYVRIAEMLQAIAAQTMTPEAMTKTAQSGAKTRAVPTMGQMNQQMLEERTYAVGAREGHTGTTEYRILFTPEGVVKATPTKETNAAPAEAYLRRAKLAALFPPGEKATLVRLFFLNCTGETCSLVLEP